MRVEKAADLLDDSLQIVEQAGGAGWKRSNIGTKATYCCVRGIPTPQRSYRKALTIAREQEAKLWGLPAAVSLAELWRDQRRIAETRDLLAPVYDWFSEGFDTADLKEANALLDQLS